MPDTPIFVRIDDSKTQLDLAMRPSDARDTLIHDAVGIDTMVTRLC